MVSQCVDVSPTTKVVERQSKGLYVSQSSQGRSINPFAGSRQWWNVFDRVEAQDQMVYAAHHGDSRLVRFRHSTGKGRSTHVGYLASDEHISGQLFRLLPSKFTVDNMVVVVGGFRRVASLDS